MTFGVDYAWHPHPSYTLMKEKDVKFVVRYISGGHDKDIDHAEAASLSKAGFNIALVWEWTAGASRQGFDKGHADAKAALANAKQVGMPSGRPIYFAVDYDANTSAQLASVKSYFNGVLSVLPKSQVGVYGSYKVVNALKGQIGWFWQTYAWSAGKWSDHNNMEQYKNEVHTGWGAGVDLDYNRAKTADYGQWRHGWVPTPPKPPAPAPAYKWNGKAPSGDPVLKMGVKSATRVKDLQSALNRGLFLKPPLSVDGDFGAKTTAAVKQLQKQFKLKEDGEYGPKSATALQNQLEP